VALPVFVAVADFDALGALAAFADGFVVAGVGVSVDFFFGMSVPECAAIAAFWP
jgi:hypothetical protein